MARKTLPVVVVSRSKARPGARIEALEARIAPAFTGSFINAGTTLHLQGTAGDDFAILTSGGANTLAVDDGDASTPATYSLAGVLSVTISGAGGNDVVTMDLTNGDPVGGRAFSFDGGGQVGDLFVVKGLANSALTWTPSATADHSGTVGGTTPSGLNYTYTTAPAGVQFNTVASVGLTTPAGADDLTQDAFNTFGLISGTVSGHAQRGTFTGVTALTVDLGANDVAATVDHYTVNSLTGPGLQNLTVNTGNGADTLTVGSSVTAFTLPTAGGAFQFNPGAGTDTLEYTADANFTLTDTGLTVLTLANANMGTISFTGSAPEIVNLTGGAGANTFTVSGYSGGGTLDGAGAQDTIAATNDVAAFDLTDAQLARTGHATLTLASIEVANLTGGAGQNTFTVSGWTGQGTLTGLGGNDTVVAVNNVADFGLSDTQLTRTGLGTLTLDTIEIANLTGGVSANTFTISAYTGDATLAGLGGADSVHLTTASAVDLTFTAAGAGTLGYPGSQIGFSDIEDLQLHGASLSLTGSAVNAGVGDGDVTWEPGAPNANADHLTVVNGALTTTVAFDGPLTSVSLLKSLTVKTPAGADDLSLSADSNHFGTISNTVTGGSYSTAFDRVNTVVIDVGVNDSTDTADKVTIASVNGITGLSSLTVNTGNGDDTVELKNAVSSLNLTVAGGAFTIDGGAGSDKLVVTAATDATLSNDASTFHLAYGDSSQLTYAGFENFDLTVNNLTLSGSDAETAVWKPSAAATDHGTISVDNTGVPTHNVTYALTGATPAVNFAHLFKLTLQTPAGADNLTLGSASTGVASISGSVGGNSGASHSGTFTNIDTVVIDLGASDATGAADTLTVSAIDAAGLRNLTVAGGAGDDALIFQNTVSSFGLNVAGGVFKFDGGDGTDSIKATATGAGTELDLTNTTLSFGDLKTLQHADVESFDLTAGSVNYTGGDTETFGVTPSGATLNSGSATITGGKTLAYHGQLGVFHVASLNVTTPAGADDFTLGGTATLGSLSGSVAGAPAVTQAIVFANAKNLTVDLGVNDDAGASDSLTVNALLAPGLQNLTVKGGGGDDKLVLTSGVTSLNLPVAGGAFNFDPGAGSDTIDATADVSMILADGGLDYQDNTAGHAAQGAVKFLSPLETALLTGGASDNRMIVNGYSAAATIKAMGGNDTFDIQNWSASGTLDGGAGNDTFILSHVTASDTLSPTSDKTGLTGWTASGTVIGGGGTTDKLFFKANASYVLSDTSFTRMELNTHFVATKTITTAISQINAAELIGGASRNLIDAGLFSGTSVLEGRGGLDNLVASKAGGEMYGFRHDAPTAQQLRNPTIRAAYSADNYFLPDGTVASSELIAATNHRGNALSFRYYEGGGGSTGITYTIPASTDTAAQSVVTGLTTPGLAVQITQGYVSNVEGSFFNDTITGSVKANILLGAHGDDTLRGAGAPVDYLIGGAGTDTLLGPGFRYPNADLTLPGFNGPGALKVRARFATN